ncbi:hypothetical protein CRYUN_Cryun37aG0104300 [Craigia yunnanensis]
MLKPFFLKERDRLLEDIANRIAYLLSALSSFKNNFELHVLESKARNTEDRLEVVTSQVEKMAEVVTEQWIQIQHLEQALQIAEFIRDLSGRPLLNTFGALDSYSLGKGSTIKYYMSQAVQQLRRFYSEIKKYHPEASALITFPILSAWVLLLSQFS